MINREPMVGVTIHYMDKMIDAGNIIMQASVPLTVNEKYQGVKIRLDRISEAMLPDAVRYALDGVEGRVQDGRKGSYFPRRYPGESEIKDFDKMSGGEIVATINALSDPMPNAYIVRGGEKVYFTGARLGDE